MLYPGKTGKNLETPTILKKAIDANKYLAELKGYCQNLPNPELLLIVLRRYLLNASHKKYILITDHFSSMHRAFEEHGARAGW
jgi:hypothetical protein